MAEHSVETQYTNQQEHLQEPAKEKEKKEQRQNEIQNFWKKEQHSMRRKKEGEPEETLRSFLHPDSASTKSEGFYKEVKGLREILERAEERGDLFIEKHGKPPSQETKRKGGKRFTRDPIDYSVVVAMLESNHKVMRKLPQPRNQTIDHFKAVSLV